MATIIKGTMAENEYIVFDQFFNDADSPFARFKGVWVETSDGKSNVWRINYVLYRNI